MRDHEQKPAAPFLEAVVGGHDLKGSNLYSIDEYRQYLAGLDTLEEPFPLTLENQYDYLNPLSADTDMRGSTELRNHQLLLNLESFQCIYDAYLVDQEKVETMVCEVAVGEFEEIDLRVEGRIYPSPIFGISFLEVVYHYKDPDLEMRYGAIGLEVRVYPYDSDSIKQNFFDVRQKQQES